MEKEREGRLSYEMKIKRGSERRYTVYHVHALTSMIRLCIHCPAPTCSLITCLRIHWSRPYKLTNNMYLYSLSNPYRLTYSMSLFIF